MFHSLILKIQSFPSTFFDRTVLDLYYYLLLLYFFTWTWKRLLVEPIEVITKSLSSFFTWLISIIGFNISSVKIILTFITWKFNVLLYSVIKPIVCLACLGNPLFDDFLIVVGELIHIFLEHFLNYMCCILCSFM